MKKTYRRLLLKGNQPKVTFWKRFCAIFCVVFLTCFVLSLLMLAQMVEEAAHLPAHDHTLVWGMIALIMLMIIGIFAWQISASGQFKQLLKAQAALQSLNAKLGQEILQRQQIETQLRQSEERFRAVFEQAAIGICIDTLESQALEVNAAFCAITGYSPAEIRSWHWSDITHPDDRETDWEQMRRLLSGEINRFSIEKRYLHKNQSWVWVNLTVSLTYDALQTPQSILVVIQDISDRKRAEQALQESEERLSLVLALQESEERFRQLAENINEVFWLFDPHQQQVLYVSPAYERIWGQTPDSLYQCSTSWIDAIHPDDQAALLSNPFDRYRRGFSEEYRIIRADGTLRWIHDRGVPIFAANGQLDRVAGIAEDITERKQAEQEICQLNAALAQQNQTLEKLVEQRTVELLERTHQLETTNQELESFCYSVSHDLRAPLRHVHGFVNVLRQRLEQQFVRQPDRHCSASLDPEISHYLDVIEDSGQKMGWLIDGLLMLSRVGRCKLEFHAVDLQGLVEDVVKTVQLDFADLRSIEFQIGQLPTVYGDAVLLQQVFSNLIDNAVKFSRFSNPPRIQIDCCADNILFVRDNGIGFSMEYSEQMFEAFQRLHSDRDFDGTGIGLAIVHRIIHRHNGIIWAESQPNQGATFYFKLT